MFPNYQYLVFHPHFSLWNPHSVKWLLENPFIWIMRHPRISGSNKICQQVIHCQDAENLSHTRRKLEMSRLERESHNLLDSQPTLRGALRRVHELIVSQARAIYQSELLHQRQGEEYR